MNNDSIRARLLVGDTQTLSASELLEALLEFGSKKNINAQRHAKSFIQRFGSLGEVISADRELLLDSKHIDERAVVLLHLVLATAQHLSRERVKEKDVLASPDALLEYIQTSMAYRKRERFMALFLDVKNALISEIAIDGTIDHAPIYPREIARQALALNAASIILVHNHPSGDPNPSLADIQMTNKIIQTCEAVGVEVIDHFIIGRSRYTSFREAGLISSRANLLVAG